MTSVNKQTPTLGKIAITRQELERLMDHKLWIASAERLHTSPPDAVHHLELHTTFFDAAGRALITPGCVRTIALADEQLADTLEHAYRVPAGILQKVPAAGPTLPFDAQEMDMQPEDKAVLSRFQAWRRALLFAFVWSYKQAPIAGPEVRPQLEALLNGLDAIGLRQSAMRMHLLENLVKVNQPPRARLPKARIEDTTAEVERWFWLGQFLGRHLLGGEKMDKEARAWFMQFKKFPYTITRPEVPPAFEKERVPILGWLLFLRIYDASDGAAERRIFEEELAPIMETLPAEEREQVYQQALLFKGFFMPQADSYYISPSAKEVFVWLEFQALLMSDLVEAETADERSAQLRVAALDTLLRAHDPDQLAKQVYAYYQAMNPMIRQREAVWFHELTPEPGAAADGEPDESAEKADTEVLEPPQSATPAELLEAEKRILLVRAGDAMDFFRKHYPAVSFAQLRQQAILFVESEGSAGRHRVENVLFFQPGNWRLDGRISVLLPGARVYASEHGLERLDELALFHPDALVPIHSLFPGLRILMVAVEDYALSEEQGLWLAQLTAATPELEKVIVINLQTGNQPKARVKEDDALMLELEFQHKLKKWVPDFGFFQLDMQKENYELIRWLRPFMRHTHWRQTGLFYLGKSEAIPDKLADALLRSQSDVIVYDPHMRYMFYNL